MASPTGTNENYAREVMELHTLGVNGGYTQKDVTELARVLTGWTLEEPRLGGGFVFRQPRHEPGDKVVLGRPSTRMASARGKRAGDAGTATGDGAIHLHQIGATLCE